MPGAWFLIHMHPVCAQNKSLISNTVEMFSQEYTLDLFLMDRVKIDVLLKTNEAPNCAICMTKGPKYNP